ncbi:MAG: right-handed parallel beta-helix repeat-containing protein [Candidatus Bathyarchaeales archaeon]
MPDDYASIQLAINSAAEGATIFVKDGLYLEQIRINKPLRIIGSGNETIIQNPYGSKTVEIVRGVNDVLFANFFINSSGATFGLYVGGQNCIIENNTIVNHQTGLCIYDSSNVTMRNNHLFNNTFNLKVWGLFLSHFLHDIDETNTVNGLKVCYLVNKAGLTVPSDAGYVGVVNSTNITVKGVNSTRNYSGILFAYTSDSLVINSSCSLNEEGLRLVFSSNISVVNNNFSLNNWSGISLIGSSNNSILNNVISRNRNGVIISYSELSPERSVGNWIYDNEISESSNAVYFDGAIMNLVQSNVISMNNVALYIENSQSNFISGNNIQETNQYGVYILSSSNNTFYHNNFQDNASCNIYIQNSVCTWSLDKLGGNYWINQSHMDGNCDGIVDAPYVINNDNIDHSPLAFPVVAFYAFKLNGETFALDLIGNFSLSLFRCDPADRLIEFHVENREDEMLFCRVTLPNCPNVQGSGCRWTVLKNVAFINCSVICLEDSTVIYAVGNRSLEVSSATVELIPETSFLTTFLLLAIFSLIVTLSRNVCKRVNA